MSAPPGLPKVQCAACGSPQRVWRSAAWNHAGRLFAAHMNAKGEPCAGSGKSPSKVRRKQSNAAIEKEK